MKGFTVVVTLCVIALTGTAFSDQMTDQDQSSKLKKVPTVYGPNAQRTRSNAQPTGTRPSDAPSRQPLQAPVKQNDLLSGNIGEIAQFSQELSITDDQMQSLQAFQNEFQKKAVELDGNVRMFRLDISRGLKKEAPDFKVIQEKTKLISDLQYQIRLAILELYEKAYGLLTPEQKAKYVLLITAKKESIPVKNSVSSLSPEASPSPAAGYQPSIPRRAPQASPADRDN